MGTARILSERLANATPTSEPLAILVVDSDDDTRQLYRRSFELAGCAVTEAADGSDALGKALMAPPSLVITEMRFRSSQYRQRTRKLRRVQ